MSDAFDVNSRTVEPQVGGTCSSSGQRVFIDAKQSCTSTIRHVVVATDVRTRHLLIRVESAFRLLRHGVSSLLGEETPTLSSTVLFGWRKKVRKKEERSGEDDGVEDGEREMDGDGTSGVRTKEE